MNCVYTREKQIEKINTCWLEKLAMHFYLQVSCFNLLVFAIFMCKKSIRNPWSLKISHGRVSILCINGSVDDVIN